MCSPRVTSEHGGVESPQFCATGVGGRVRSLPTVIEAPAPAGAARAAMAASADAVAIQRLTVLVIAIPRLTADAASVLLAGCAHKPLDLVGQYAVTRPSYRSCAVAGER